MFLGSWKINDYLPITAVTHRFSTGAAYDATSINYSIYEFATDGTPTEVVTDTAMTKRDSKTGFYVNVCQLTAAAGFDKGGRYVVYIAATVDGVAGIEAHTFQIEAEVDVVSVDGTSGAGNAAADALLNRNMGTGTDDNTRSPRNALRFLRNKWVLTGTALSVKKEDDSTEAWASTVTTNAAAEPITSSDPAGP